MVCKVRAKDSKMLGMLLVEYSSFKIGVARYSMRVMMIGLVSSLTSVSGQSDQPISRISVLTDVFLEKISLTAKGGGKRP